MKIGLIISILALSTRLHSQNIQQKGLPHFRIAQTDKKYIDEKVLNKNQDVIFIYFLPDCDDCRKFTARLLVNMNFFKQVQIVMITNSNLPMLAQFEKEFRLRTYTNIITGTESYTAVFQNKFTIESFPFAAVYHKKIKQIQVLANYKDPDLLIEKLKALIKQTH